MSQVHAWTAATVAGLLTTLAPFQKHQSDKWIARIASTGVSAVALSLALKEDSRITRRKKAGEVLTLESSIIGQAIELVKKPQPVLISQQSQLLPAAVVVDQRDLTSEMASYDGHVLIASRTRSGKTTSIQSCLYQTYQHYQGNCEFWIFDPKGAAWCCLQKDEARYLLCNKESLIDEVLTRLGTIINILETRQTARVAAGGHWLGNLAPHPIIIVIDEFNTLRALAKNAGSKQESQLKSKVERLIFQGAEDKLYVRLMAQTTRVENLGLNTSVQDNLAFFAQSRNGDYQSVEDAIANPYVVSSSSERKRLQETLNQYKADTKRDRSVPIAFTTLGGNQLCLLPDLRDAAQKEIAIDAKAVQNLPDSQLNEPDNLKKRTTHGQLEPLLEEESSAFWTVRKVRELYPNTSPEQLFLSVSAALEEGVSVRDVIRSVLKCGESNSHPSRSYTRHGKTLLKWLIENYDDGAIANLPEIKKFLGGWKE